MEKAMVELSTRTPTANRKKHCKIEGVVNKD